jgi:hypothetical protein
MAEELDFESQERERRWVGVQVGKRRRQEAVEVRELRQYLEKWSGRPSIPNISIDEWNY